MSRRTHPVLGCSLSWDLPAIARRGLTVLLALAALPGAAQAQHGQPQPSLSRPAIPQVQAARRMEAQRPRPIRQVLVKFKTAVAPAAFARAFSVRYTRSAKAAPALTYRYSLREIDWHVFQLPSSSALPDTLAALRHDPRVLNAEPNQSIRPLTLAPPNNTKWGVRDLAHTQASLNFLDPASDSSTWTYSWYLETVHALDAWNVYPGLYPSATDRITQLANDASRMPLVAVLDTGIDFSHPGFAYPGQPDGDISHGGQFQTSLARKIVGGVVDSNVADLKDQFGHGTSVAGIIGAAVNNGQDLPGLGFVCRLVPIKIYDDSGNGSNADLAQAITYATDNGCLLINISARVSSTYSSALQDAVDYAWNHGSLVIAAIGNDGSKTIRRWPASCARALSVGATLYGGLGTINGEVPTSYSNYGPNLGVVAPGGGATAFFNTANDPNGLIGSTPIELTFLYTTAPTYTPANFSSGSPFGEPGGLYGQNYGEITGTSYSTAVVTGLAALYAAKNGITQSTPNGPLTILQAIERGSDNTANRSDGGFDLGDTSTGRAGVGYGRINALATLQDTNNRHATVGGIVGLVKNNGVVQPNITVTVKQNGTAVGTAQTTVDGAFHLLNLPEGSYTISATIGGKLFTRTVQVTAGCDEQGVDLGNAAIAITPNPAVMNFGGTLQLAAAVSGLTDTTVTWSVVSGGGSFSTTTTGLYQAPAAPSGAITGTAVIQATSNMDSSVLATLTILLVRGEQTTGPTPVRSLPTPQPHVPPAHR